MVDQNNSSEEVKDKWDDLLSLHQEMQELEHKFPEELFESFNIFESADLIRQEIRHSSILKFLLTPISQHGLGDFVVHKLIDIAAIKSTHEEKPNQLKMALSDFDDLQVRREDMSIDVLAWSEKNNVVLVIENKVDASEGEGQLLEYREKIISRFKGWRKLFVYLTIDGDDPTDDEWWVAVSYSEILDILNDALRIHHGAISEDVLLFIKHYKELIRRHIVDDYSEELKDECKKLYEKHKNIFKFILSNLDNPINTASDSFLSGNNLTQMFRNKNRLAFLTKELFNKIPDVRLSRGWYGQYKPILFWYSYSYDDSRIKLVFEVGPWEDIDKRSKLVEMLRQKIRNARRGARGDVYSRIWSRTEDISDIGDSEEVLRVMERLFKSLFEEGIIKAAEDSVFETWHSVN